MTIKKASDGSRLTKTAFTSLLGAATKTVNYYTVPEDIIETYDTTGSNPKNFESQTKKKFTAGQVITTADINAAFPTATVSSPSTAAPRTALPAAGGTTITITGDNFAGVNAVQTEGGTAFTNVKVVSNNKITATTPAKTAGTYDLIVKDDAGDVTVTDALVYV